jgi:hypothetical protein
MDNTPGMNPIFGLLTGWQDRYFDKQFQIDDRNMVRLMAIGGFCKVLKPKKEALKKVSVSK